MAEVSSASAAPHRWTRFASPAVDVLTATLAALTTLLLAPSPAWPWAVSVLLTAGTALAGWRGIHGGSLGHTMLRVRTVDAVTGLPSFRFHARRATVVRGGTMDPFALRPRPVATAQAAPTASRVAMAGSHLRLVVDDGTSHIITYAAVIGRDPTVPPDSRHVLVAIPDLTRTISKAHFLAQVTEQGVVVTDLRSANGTWVLGHTAPLPPRQPTLVAWESTLLLGDRQVLLQRRVRESSEGKAS
ncbi:FHA domain-containing protein [Propionicicella superfundia]|uniref:FHA domain-containing protein n=1 Tax=Propionicicella superfundia TaxID=348582 RepID=UPI0004905E74|nr:FHA domain-containing protein [Propionicicella superfundia]